MTPESDHKTAAILSAVLAGSTPTFPGVAAFAEAAVEIRPLGQQANSGQTANVLNGNGSGIADIMQVNLPTGSLDETYGVGPSLHRTATTQTRELVLTQPAEREEALHTEHAALVDRRFADGLSSVEQRRLDYVRWQIHQLQDARQGEHLDGLSQRAREYATFASDVLQLKAELLDLLPKRRRK